MASAAKNDFWLSLGDLADFLGQSPEDCLKKLQQDFGPLNSRSHIAPAIVRQVLSQKGHKFPHKIISFQMLKGGVAKTTSCLNFGLRAAMYGAKVLFVDMDQQANLSFALGVEDESLPVWVDLIEKKAKVRDLIVRIDEGIDLIPSSLNNSVLDRVLLMGNRNWAQSVKAPLEEVFPQYDLILIDTAPNLSATNTAVTCSSHHVLLPINPDKFSILGLRKNLEDLSELKREFGLEFSERILFTKFDGREAASREILAEVAEEFADKLLQHYIRTSSEVKNNIRGTRRHLFQVKSSAKEDYDQVTREMMEWV